MAPPHSACQTSPSRRSLQNSHIESVDGWMRVRCASDPAAGRASAGSGTRSNALLETLAVGLRDVEMHRHAALARSHDVHRRARLGRLDPRSCAGLDLAVCLLDQRLCKTLVAERRCACVGAVPDRVRREQARQVGRLGAGAIPCATGHELVALGLRRRQVGLRGRRRRRRRLRRRRRVAVVAAGGGAEPPHPARNVTSTAATSSVRWVAPRPTGRTTR